VNKQGVFAHASLRGLLLAGVAACLAAPHAALAFQTTIDGWEVSLDTTLSSSADIRTSPIDYNFVGIDNGGKFGVANADNGTLNYKDGSFVAAQQRITTELQIKRDDYGLFVRATGFYDPIIDSETTQFQPLTRAAVRDIGADLRLLDAYVFFSPQLFGHTFDVRAGAQALNWGESTFIQFGINSINPLDVTQLRTPGAELRTAFLPIPVIDVKTELGGDFSLEGFWQPVWTRTRLEPLGSFFGTNDTVTDGARWSNLFSYYPDALKSEYAVSLGEANPFGGVIPRADDRHPTGLDEFGFALRKTVPALGDAEFGLYFENYDSRTPFASFRTGNANISGLPGAFATLPNPLGSLFADPYSYATKTYISTASYFDDYPKDIHLAGVSWNFNAPGGIAIQGEFSQRFNQPIQLSGSDLALAINAPAICSAAAVSPLLAGACAEAKADPTIQAAGGVAGFNQIIDGWKRYEVSQIQTTATKLYNSMPQLYINSVALIGEIGFDLVDDFPRNRGIFNASYTTDTNSAFEEAATVDTAVVPGTNYTVGHLSTKGLATQFSGGSTIASIIDMPSVLPYGIDMKPTISLQYDFVGTSPVGVNVFQENTAAASVGVTFLYLQAWSLNTQYTNHFPVFAGPKFYGAVDRDFVSATLSYEF
jgi:hypothetical protein